MPQHNTPSDKSYEIVFTRWESLSFFPPFLEESLIGIDSSHEAVSWSCFVLARVAPRELWPCRKRLDNTFSFFVLFFVCLVCACSEALGKIMKHVGCQVCVSHIYFCSLNTWHLYRASSWDFGVRAHTYLFARCHHVKYGQWHIDVTRRCDVR